MAILVYHRAIEQIDEKYKQKHNQEIDLNKDDETDLFIQKINKVIEKQKIMTEALKKYLKDLKEKSKTNKL